LNKRKLFTVVLSAADPKAKQGVIAANILQTLKCISKSLVNHILDELPLEYHE
jgi:hypothetical protein